MTQMKQLIEEMICKGFYNTENERLPLLSHESVHEEHQKNNTLAAKASQEDNDSAAD